LLLLCYSLFGNLSALFPQADDEIIKCVVRP